MTDQIVFARDVFALFICLFFVCSSTATKAQAPAVTPQMKRAAKVTHRADVSWAKAWTEDDTAYAKLRKEVELALASARQPEALVAQYGATAKETVENPQNLFRWSYATWLLGERIGNYEARKRIHEVRRYLQMASPTPNTYNFVRLRFLIECRIFPGYSKLDPIGRRLVAENPRDYQVKRRYISVLEWSKSQEDRETALKYAREVLKSDPSNPVLIAVLGHVYMLRWRSEKRPGDARSAIAYLQRANTAAPKDSELRSSTQYWIGLLQNDLKKAKVK